MWVGQNWMEEVDEKTHLVLVLAVCFPFTNQKDGTCVATGWISHKQTKKMSQTWWKLLFAPLLPSFPLRLSVTLSKILMLVAYFKKKKTLKIASHHDMQEYQWELNMKAWRTKREEELQEKEANIKCKRFFFFPLQLQCFCLWGKFLSLAPTKFSLQAFSESRGKISK